jgi:hypothetical protein
VRVLPPDLVEDIYDKGSDMGAFLVPFVVCMCLIALLDDLVTLALASPPDEEGPTHAQRYR